MAGEAPVPLQNLLLAALPAEARSRLLPHLELVPLSQGRTLFAPGETVRHAYFPIDCVISLLSRLQSGASGEVAMVGSEGVVGISLFLGVQSAATETVVRCAGYAHRGAAPRLLEEFSRHSELMLLLLRYTQLLTTQIAQTAVCNRHHSIEQQLCRTLLMTLDRVPGNRLNLTQELIGHMLGVRREGVTEAAGKLQKAGAIDYRRGRITVLSRQVLEKLSCECYAVVRQQGERLLSCSLPASPHIA